MSAELLAVETSSVKCADTRSCPRVSEKLELKLGEKNRRVGLHFVIRFHSEFREFISYHSKADFPDPAKQTTIRYFCLTRCRSND